MTNQKNGVDAAQGASDNLRVPRVRIPNVRTSGDFDDLQRRVWQVIQMCWTVVRSEHTTLEEKRQFGHLLSQTAGTYTRLLEGLDLKRELEALRSELAELRTAGADLRKVV